MEPDSRGGGRGRWQARALSPRRRRGAERAGGLLLDILSEEPEKARGVAAIAHALSREVCRACGGAGHPAVELRTAAPTTLCDSCRGTWHGRAERPAWRRRDRGHELEAEPLVEDLIGDDELAALVEAHFAPTDHRGWPRTMFTTQGGIVWTVGGAGWNALLRAAFAVLLPLQCEGQTTPLPIGQVKERLGALIVDAWPSDDFRQGVVDVLTCYSQRICIHCGQPGTLRDGPTPWAGSAPSARRAGRRHRRTPGRPSAQRDREDKHPARAGMDRGPVPGAHRR